MEILFRQARIKDQEAERLFAAYGIEGCMLKQLCIERDRANITRKRHHHTAFEVHIIDEGFQEYEADGARFHVKAGELFIIPPLLKHTTLSEDAHTIKHAFTFLLKEDSPLLCADLAPAVFPTPPSVSASLASIHRELSEAGAFHLAAVSLYSLASLLSILRLCTDLKKESAPAKTENERLLLVKEYVDANAQRAVSLSELASYACISEKQLERIFLKETGLSAMAYVRKKRCQRIERLLEDPSLSLKEISEECGFSNEYYFNAFFKRYAGITPGAYRRSVLK